MARAVAVIELLMLDSSAVVTRSGVLVSLKALWRIAEICMEVGREGAGKRSPRDRVRMGCSAQLASRELAQTNNHWLSCHDVLTGKG